MNINIINGPNLNLLGKREPEKYGKISFDDFLESLRKRYPSVNFEYFHSNVEGEIINDAEGALRLEMCRIDPHHIHTCII